MSDPLTFACHHCDNPACIHPDHLYPGDFQSNSDDKMNRGKSMIGKDNGRAKLTEIDVRNIRAKHGEAANLSDLSRSYGVTATAIRHIINGKNWRHVA